MGPYIIYPDEVNRNRWIEKLNITAENRLTITTPVKDVLITGALIFLCQLLFLTFTNLYTCFLLSHSSFFGRFLTVGSAKYGLPSAFPALI